MSGQWYDRFLGVVTVKYGAASVWATPVKTGYAYYAPPGAFWGR